MSAPKLAVTWLNWIFLAAIAGAWSFAWLTMANDHERQTAETLRARVSASGIADSSTSPERRLLGLKLLMPHLEQAAPLDIDTLRDDVNVLEAALVSGQVAPVPTLAGISAGVSMLIDALDAEMRRRHRQSQVLELVTLLCLAAITFIGFQLWYQLWYRARHRRESRLVADDSLQSLLFDHVPVAAVVTDADDRIVSANPAYTRLTGYAMPEVVGRPLNFNHSGQQDEDFFQAMRESLIAHDQWVGEFWLRNKDGEAFADKVTRVSVKEDTRLLGYLTLSHDVLGADDTQRLMLWQAHHDTLTKLPNRNLFQERLSRVLLRAQEDDFLGALISIDLDRFKNVNDSVGPAKGDQVLMDAAYRIAMAVRQSDTVARLGGDHFVVLASEIEDLREIERIAHGVLEAMEKPFVLENEQELFVTASVGVSVIPQDGSETGELLQKADAARIQVKQEGGNSIAFFEQQMNARAERRMLLESALRKAVLNGELVLHYQPVVDIKRGEVSSAEALLRWQHPQFGMVSPGEFIPIAEDTGLIIEIGQWVVRECQRQLRDWRDKGIEDLRISLNVSAVQIRQDHDVQGLLSMLEAGDASCLTIELTESALIDNSEGAQTFLRGARALGSRVALDDFGTGFSSLGYLRHFEFDVLKIDKTFIDELEDTRDFGLVASIVSMGRILGMKVVAEGVEQASQIERLRQIGCDFVQGYYYSRPLPVDEFERFISDPSLRDVG